MSPRIDSTPVTTPTTAPVHTAAPKRTADVEVEKKPEPKKPAKGVDNVSDAYERSEKDSVARGAAVVKAAPAVVATDEHAQHVAQVRKDLAAQKLPTSAKGVAVIVVGEVAGSAHGDTVTRTIAGPTGLAKDAAVHLRKSGQFEGKYLDTNADMKAIKASKAPLTVADYGKMGAAQAEASMYAAREEIKAINKGLPADGKTRIASLSWGKSVNRIAVEAAVALPKDSQIFKDKIAQIEKDRPGTRVSVDNPKHMQILRSLVAKDIGDQITTEMAKPDAKKRFDGLKGDLEKELATANKKGLLVFNAAGNDRETAVMLGDEKRSTNFFDGVKGLVTVGAADLKKGTDGSDDAMWAGSSTGKVRVAAPGVNLPVGAGGAAETGTSFATPYMASVAALMVAANPKITPDQIVAILDSGKVTKDLAGTTDGKGLIDPVKAVAAAQALGTAAKAN